LVSSSAAASVLTSTPGEVIAFAKITGVFTFGTELRPFLLHFGEPSPRALRRRAVSSRRSPTTTGFGWKTFLHQEVFPS
jgi:hypothetical protein